MSNNLDTDVASMSVSLLLVALATTISDDGGNGESRMDDRLSQEPTVPSPQSVLVFRSHLPACYMYFIVLLFFHS